MSAPATLGEKEAGLAVAKPRARGVEAIVRALPLLGLWLGAGTVLAAITTRVRDWYAMPNELLSERRAISAARTLSPLPTIHRQFVASFDQLYPLVIAPVFRYGDVLTDVRNAHAVNAFVMTSACIPAFLLARRVTASRPLAYLVAALSVSMPWIFYAVMLMDEVVAYPVFLWVALAVQRSLVAPSRGRDLAALGVIALSFFARTQFAALALVYPIAIVAYELAAVGAAPGVRPSVVRRLRNAIGNHRVAAVVYGIGVATAVGLAVSGELGKTLGVYGDTITGNLLPHGIPKSLAWHLACFAIGVGILPLVVGLAWLLATLVRPGESAERQAFASFGGVAAVVLLLQVTIFDLRYVGGLVLDRYLIYLVPLVLLGFVSALQLTRPLRLSLVLVAAVVSVGFAVGAIPTEHLAAIDSDAPIQAFYPPLVAAATSLTDARVFLVGATLLSTAGFVAGRTLLSKRRFLLVFMLVPVVCLPLLTEDLFARFFHDKGWSFRAVTSGSGESYGWFDQKVGPAADVTIVPYPTSSDYFVSEREWRDYEFWNKSVDRDVQLSAPGIFDFTNDTFPKLYPSFNPTTGKASITGSPYVVEADQETRARISGVVLQQSDVMLIRAHLPWRADWISWGLYDDGWTRPDTTAHVRVFSPPGAHRNELRSLTFGFRSLDDSVKRPVVITANHRSWSGSASSQTTWATVFICLPAHGYTDVSLRAPVVSTIPGDLATWSESQGERRGGVFVSQISLADEVGGPCKP